MQSDNKTSRIQVTLSPRAFFEGGNNSAFRSRSAHYYADYTVYYEKNERGDTESMASIGQCTLYLDEKTGKMRPALWVDNGSEQLIVPLAGTDAVHRARVQYEALARITADGARAQVYVFGPAGQGHPALAVFFSKGESVLEDPATGSATANLGGWYLAQQAALPLSRTISQGEHTGRPSALQLRIDVQRNVFVAGELMELGRGYVEL